MWLGAIVITEEKKEKQLGSQVAQFTGGLSQLITKLGMGYVYQLASSLSDSLAIERSDAIFSHNVVHIVTRGGHTGAFRQ